MVLARVMSPLCRSHGLSARRAGRTKSRGLKGLQPEVGARRAPRLLSMILILDMKSWIFGILIITVNVQKGCKCNVTALTLLTQLRLLDSTGNAMRGRLPSSSLGLGGVRSVLIIINTFMAINLSMKLQQYSSIWFHFQKEKKVTACAMGRGQVAQAILKSMSCSVLSVLWVIRRRLNSVQLINLDQTKDSDGEDIQCPRPDPVQDLHLILMGRTTRVLILLLTLSWSWSWWVGRPVLCSSSPQPSPPSPLSSLPSAWPTLKNQVPVENLSALRWAACFELWRRRNHFFSVPISHVSSLQGTTAVLPCDVRSTSGWVGFFCFSSLHFFVNISIFLWSYWFLQADVFLVLWFKDNATKPMYRWATFWQFFRYARNATLCNGHWVTRSLSRQSFVLA